MKNQQDIFYVQSRGVCEQTGKRCFYYTNASQVSRYERRRRQSNHHPYSCKACGNFHVGSSEDVLKNLHKPIRRKK